MPTFLLASKGTSAMFGDVEALRADIERIVAEEGAELIDIKLSVSRGSNRLRVFIDKEGGVTIDDCVEINRKIEDFMFVKGIAKIYSLEVSSPGPERPLKTERDFNRIIGRKVKIQAAGFKGGVVSGRVIGCENNVVRLNVKGREISVPLDHISKARIEFEIP